MRWVGVTFSIMSARSSMRAPSQPEGRATEASTSWPPVNPMAMARSAAVRALSGRPASCSARRGGVGRAITQVGQTVRIEVAEVRAEAGVELRVPGLGDPFGGTAEFPQGAAPAAALACPCPATDAPHRGHVEPSPRAGADLQVGADAVGVGVHERTTRGVGVAVGVIDLARIKRHDIARGEAASAGVIPARAHVHTGGVGVLV
jgi:hypothetical protein